MKFTLGWLKDHLDTSLSLDEIAAALTRTGLEVEGIENPGAKLAAFRIAHVLEAVPHPNADKLRVCRVDTGDGVIQVVCGAPNARTGMKAVLGRPGDHVPGLDVTLRETEIRGQKSQGMMCSSRELQLGDDHDGIIDLPADAPVGTAYADWAGLNDPVIEVAITPNRQDCLGVAGIARDLAAAGYGTLKSPPVPAVQGSYDSPVAIETDDASACPVFAGRYVRGVVNGPSPDWMQRRLKAIGLRPISVLVDITQYVMIDRARPLHVYDAATVTGTLRARLARAGETLLALDGRTYTLDETMCVIADDAAVLGLAGVMGGEGSGVTAATTDIVIESAWFDPVRTGATGRALGLGSDARYRFERGVDPAFVIGGLDLATALVVELCGGTASRAVVAGAEPVADKVVTLRPQRVASLGGLDVAADEQRAILERLGYRAAGADAWRVPSWRRDVDGEADLVEDVLRLKGYDHIPATPLPRRDGVALPTATPTQTREKRLRRLAAARGFAEAITWSFIAPAEAALFGGGTWTLENPISADLAVMRPSLLPGLLAAAARNQNRGAVSIRLFETGKRYLQAEHATLALIAGGAKSDRHWSSGKASGFDVFDAKAEALALLEAAGVPVARLTATAEAPGWYHPGRSGVLKLGPKAVLAQFGELHPNILKAFDLRGTAVALELFLDALPVPKASRRARPAFNPSDLPSVERDFAFLVAAGVEAARLLAAVRGADKQAISDVRIFDVFTGAGVPDGRKSIALSVTLTPTAQTFTDAEIEAISARIVGAAAKSCDAVLRG